MLKSSTTTKLLPPVTPGEILNDLFMKPSNLSANALAKSIGVSVSRILGILDKTRGITADTAMRLSLYFGTTPELWMNMQAGYDLELVKREKLETLKKTVSKEWRRKNKAELTAI